MDDKVFVDWDYSLAAVKSKGKWRFFYDIESMFLLDYTSFEDDYSPVLGDWRYGLLVVTQDNAEQWMAALAGELQIDQLAKTYWRDTNNRVPLTFVIDFDQKLWIGQMWKMDQSPLQDYQPKGWLAKEDAVLNYLPPDIRKYWA
ncbi:MAG: hypothetical protein NVS9B9_31840 [Ktedonobacteraceae bacterium]